MRLEPVALITRASLGRSRAIFLAVVFRDAGEELARNPTDRPPITVVRRGKSARDNPTDVRRLFENANRIPRAGGRDGRRDASRRGADDHDIIAQILGMTGGSKNQRADEHKSEQSHERSSGRRDGTTAYGATIHVAADRDLPRGGNIT